MEKDAIHQALQDRLSALGGSPVPVFFCPHHPDEGCRCRKPAPGLLLDAMQALGAHARETCFLGDSQKDLDAAAAAGCTAILVLTGNGGETLKRSPGALTFDNLASFANAYGGTA